MHKEFQSILSALEGELTIPRNPKVIQILPGKTVFEMQ